MEAQPFLVEITEGAAELPYRKHRFRDVAVMRALDQPHRSYAPAE